MTENKALKFLKNFFIIIILLIIYWPIISMIFFSLTPINHLQDWWI